MNRNPLFGMKHKWDADDDMVMLRAKKTHASIDSHLLPVRKLILALYDLTICVLLNRSLRCTQRSAR